LLDHNLPPLSAGEVTAITQNAISISHCYQMAFVNRIAIYSNGRLIFEIQAAERQSIGERHETRLLPVRRDFNLPTQPGTTTRRVRQL
jgi:hypothetical protein